MLRTHALPATSEHRRASTCMESSNTDPQEDAAQEHAGQQPAPESRIRFSLLSAVSLRQPAEPQTDLTVQVNARRKDQQARMSAAFPPLTGSVCVPRPALTASSWHSTG